MMVLLVDTLLITNTETVFSLSVNSILIKTLLTVKIILQLKTSNGQKDYPDQLLGSMRLMLFSSRNMINNHKTTNIP